MEPCKGCGHLIHNDLNDYCSLQCEERTPGSPAYEARSCTIFEIVPLRPVGHVTELIAELRRWSRARKNLGLNATPLDRAAVYLEEYRALLKEKQDKAWVKRVVESVMESTRRYGL